MATTLTTPGTIYRNVTVTAGLGKLLGPGGFLDMALAVGGGYFEAREHEPAKHAYELALQIDPDNVEALCRMGRLALIENENDAALEYFSAAFCIEATAATSVNLALAHAKTGDYVQALKYCAGAHVLQPGFAPAYIQQAAIYEILGQYQDALDVIEEGLKHNPANVDLMFGRGCMRLLLGDPGGWEDYEQRPSRLELAARLDEYTEWTNQDLHGKKLLVVREQGIGDQIMFARAIPELKRAGAEITLFVGVELARLFAAAFPDIRVVTTDEELADYEPDYWVSICSLGTIAAACGPSAYLQRESHRLPPGPLRVGLCWKGNKQHRHEKFRSIPFELLAPVVSIPGVEFYSLQQWESHEIGNIGCQCHDILDLAREMEKLDLVISCDSAPLHLAGAIGVPAWGLIYTPTDWRWGASGALQTSWYDLVTLFRQTQRGEWTSVIALVAEQLYTIKSRVVPPHTTAECSTASASSSPSAPAPACRSTRYGRRMLYWPNDHYIGRAIAEYGEYSESEAELLRTVLKAGDVVVEAGANIGGLTLPMAEAVGLSGRILAFEPQPAYANLLARNRLENVSIFDAALGREPGSILLDEIPFSRIHAPGWKGGPEKRRVPVTTIDTTVEDRLDLIKIDVDGMELEILEGANRSIAEFRPIIYVEYDKPEQYAGLPVWLMERGYKLYLHDAPLFNPKNWAKNPVNVFGNIVSRMILAIPEERKDLRFPKLARVRG